MITDSSLTGDDRTWPRIALRREFGPDCAAYAATISGTVPAMERPAFAKLVDRLEAGDTLVVAELGRPGRNTADAG